MANITLEGGRAEEGGYVTFLALLSAPAPATVTVEYRTHGGTASAGVDLYEYSGTLQFAAGETVREVRVYVPNDLLAESDEAFELELSNPIGAGFGNGIHSLRAVGWALDTDVGGGQRSVAVSTPIVLERDGNVQFVVSLSEAFASTTILDFATVAGSARGGSDFSPSSGTVTFAAGQTEAIVSVGILDDRKVEASESFGLSVTGAGLAGFGNARILNDDGRTPVLSLEGGRAEEGEYVTFIARLSEPAAAAVTVQYQTRGGTALAGVDHYEYSGTLQFAAGETVKEVRVYAVNDNLGEPDEAFELELLNPVGAKFGGLDHSLRATGTILDGDVGGGQRSLSVSSPIQVEGKGRVEFTLQLSEAYDTDRTLDFRTIAGSAEAGSDFARASGHVTFHAGQTEAVVGVNLRNGGKAEAAETFTLAVSGPGVAGAGQARILDDDGRRTFSVEGGHAEEGEYVTFAIRLSEAAKAPVTVDYRTVSGTALAGVDFYDQDGTLTFAAGETTKNVRVYVVADRLSESDEHFRLELSNPVGGRFDKGDLRPTGIAYTVDVDPGFQKRILTVADARVGEAGGNADFVVGISRALEDDLVIRFKTENGSARGKDFDVTKGKFTIAAGETEAVVSIDVKNDRRSEGLETFKLKLTHFDDRDLAPSGHDLQATATIVDDDRHGGRMEMHFDSLL